MDPSEVNETLKSRSGQSLKVRVVALKQLVFQVHIFFLVIFANENCRVGLLMRNTEKDDRRVSVDSSFFLNNLQHIDTHHNIPVFKLSSSSSTKLSNKPVLNYLPINDETLNTIAAAINIADYVPNVGPLPPYSCCRTCWTARTSRTSPEHSFSVSVLCHKSCFYH